jgi:hypothetical protein
MPGLHPRNFQAEFMTGPSVTISEIHNNPQWTLQTDGFNTLKYEAKASTAGGFRQPERTEMKLCVQANRKMGCSGDVWSVKLINPKSSSPLGRLYRLRRLERSSRTPMHINVCIAF